MSKAGGFITLHRQLLDWEWYKDTNTKVLFLHLLLKANYKDMSFEGHKILRGQLVTSLPSLASQTGLTVRQIRVSLDKLKMTGEVTSSSYPRYRIITIVKYNDYQDDDRQDVSQMTGEMSSGRQADDRLMTGKWQADDRLVTASKQYNNNNKENKGTIQQGERKSASRFSPPTKDQIFDFCMDNGLNLDVDRFYDYYSMQGWKLSNGNPMRDWQAAVRQWVARDKKRPQQESSLVRNVKKVVAQNYEQRDYSDEDAEAMRRMLKMGGML